MAAEVELADSGVGADHGAGTLDMQEGNARQRSRRDVLKATAGATAAALTSPLLTASPAAAATYTYVLVLTGWIQATTVVAGVSRTVNRQ
ncbi:twin-arginine translocation signal domain-containing protein [Streptomyces sp. AC550_RSS872]|uniref:twin-arginine translocation signal domain-containing protein n=1 Tax=Streptomyces sp. AC550_RSS872 TaxID=2823689 RepID=UPI001C2782FD|nr:twin-arginine translocation signal domain-containing protein [Streptomyces sp. AC550_RSS872]